MALAVTAAAPATAALLGLSSGQVVSSRSSVSLKTASLNRAFGLKTGHSRVTCMATHKITLRTPTGETVIECPDDGYILDAGEEAELELPSSCRSGACSSCAGKIISGSVDQSEGSFLEDEQIDEGYVLTCIAYPTSDLVIETHKEDDI